MRKVSRLTAKASVDTLAAKVKDLCDASQEQTEDVADAYTITVPTGFLPVRSLDLTQPLTATSVGAVVATLILDFKARGVNRKQANV